MLALVEVCMEKSKMSVHKEVYHGKIRERSMSNVTRKIRI